MSAEPFRDLMLRAAVSAIIGCPWVTKGREQELAQGMVDAVLAELGPADGYIAVDREVLKAALKPGPEAMELLLALNAGPIDVGPADEYRGQ